MCEKRARSQGTRSLGAHLQLLTLQFKRLGLLVQLLLREHVESFGVLVSEVKNVAGANGDEVVRRRGVVAGEEGGDERVQVGGG